MPTSPLILVVDDDEDDRLFIRDAFREHLSTCQLVTAPDGVAALEWLATAPQVPTLMLLDINMPRMNGLEVLRKIRESTRWRSLPVVMFTTSRESEMVCRAYEAGANSYVVKPDLYPDFGPVLKQTLEYWVEFARVPDHLRLHAPVR
jgi:CheY-like chemotaxis protein